MTEESNQYLLNEWIVKYESTLKYRSQNHGQMEWRLTAFQVCPGGPAGWPASQLIKNCLSSFSLDQPLLRHTPHIPGLAVAIPAPSCSHYPSFPLCRSTLTVLPAYAIHFNLVKYSKGLQFFHEILWSLGTRVVTYVYGILQCTAQCFVYGSKRSKVLYLCRLFIIHKYII